MHFIRNQVLAGQFMAGILLPGSHLLELVYDMGYRFVAAGSDGGMVMPGMQVNRKAMTDLDRLVRVGIMPTYRLPRQPIPARAALQTGIAPAI